MGPKYGTFWKNRAEPFGTALPNALWLRLPPQFRIFSQFYIFPSVSTVFTVFIVPHSFHSFSQFPQFPQFLTVSTFSTVFVVSTFSIVSHNFHSFHSFHSFPQFPQFSPFSRFYVIPIFLYVIIRITQTFPRFLRGQNAVTTATAADPAATYRWRCQQRHRWRHRRHRRCHRHGGSAVPHNAPGAPASAPPGSPPCSSTRTGSPRSATSSATRVPLRGCRGAGGCAPTRILFCTVLYAFGSVLSTTWLHTRHILDST